MIQSIDSGQPEKPDAIFTVNDMAFPPEDPFI
jgi:hypothetical protein